MNKIKAEEGICCLNSYPKPDDLAVNLIQAPSPDFTFTLIHFSALTKIFIPVSRAHKEK